MSFGEAEPDLEPDPALRQALDQWTAPQARPEFKVPLRDRFLAAPFEPRAATLEPDLDLGPEPVVAPRWGEFSAPAPSAAPSAAAPPRPWLTWGSILAIAAAVLLIYRWPAPGGWRVASSSDYLLARVDGQEFSREEAPRLAAALATGSFVEVEGGSLDLVLDQRIALSLASGGALTLVAVPEPDVLADLWLDQQCGSLAVVTGPDFPGAALRVQTPDAEVRVLGTQLAVDVIEGSGTCVCCSEGSVSVLELPLPEDPRAAVEAEHRLEQGRMRFVFHDHRPMEIGASIADHTAPIEVLRQIWPGVR